MFTNSFDQFIGELGQKLKVAKDVGVPKDKIVSRAEDVGDWLAKHYDPKNPEQRLLKELWTVADSNEQKAIASAVVKLVDQKAKATV